MSPSARKTGALIGGAAAGDLLAQPREDATVRRGDLRLGALLAACRSQLAQQLSLGLVEPGRDAHVDVHEEVSATPDVQVPDAEALEGHDVARLGARLE